MSFSPTGYVSNAELTLKIIFLCVSITPLGSPVVPDV